MSELVRVKIDGKEIQVPKGMNLIEAAKLAGIDIPHYCYHPHLSIAGNCRMCQCKVEGQAKLPIACNTTVTDGMVVSTQETSPEVAEAQRATLEFLLINHPLDCTVCDQAGHCKLQDYYYDYNTKASRFIEDKVHKVKAEPFGPEVIYDGERCIACTRCVRFCDEVTETGELALLNRGDKVVIAVQEGHELNNPLSGSVVDLCPVGALTHRRWRFNTRVWYTDDHNSICTGCSTGCNSKVYTRDGNVTHVKARLNSEVNREWMCDEGRYGFDRFTPKSRLQTSIVRSGNTVNFVGIAEAFAAAKKLAGGDGSDSAVFISPFLTLEEMWVAFEFAAKVMKVTPASGNIQVALRTRNLTETESVLISPDFAPNARAAHLLGLGRLDDAAWRDHMEDGYEQLLAKVHAGGIKRILFVGDFSLLAEDADSRLLSALRAAEVSVTITPRASDIEALGTPHAAILNNDVTVALPGRTVHERGGVMVNRDLRLQRLTRLYSAAPGSFADWMLLSQLAVACGVKILPDNIQDERALFRHVVGQIAPLKDLSLMKIGEQGISLAEVGAPQAVQTFSSGAA